MPDQIAVVTFDTPASTGTFDVTDPSITETFSAAILIYSGFLTDDTDNTHGIIGIGFVAPDGGAATQEQAIGMCAESGLTTVPDTGVKHSITDCIDVPDPTAVGAAAQILAQYSATISGGVRLNFSTTTVRARVTAILFAGLSRAYVSNISSSATPAHATVGGTTDFEPDLLVFVTTDGSVNTNVNDASPSIGFAINDGSGDQVCAYVNADDATDPSDADGFIRSAVGFGNARSRTAGAINVGLGTVSSFDSTGFNHSATASGTTAHFLALQFSEGVRLACANLAVAASTGEQSFNAFGFTPDLVLGMSTLLAAEDTTTDGPTASCSGYFSTGRYGSRAYTWHHEEGITVSVGTPSNAHSRQEDVAVLTYDHTGAVAHRASWVGATGSGGFQLNFSDAASVGFLTALGIQLIPGHIAPRRVPVERRKQLVRPGIRNFLPMGAPPRLQVPITRLLKAIGRMRRSAIARLRYKEFRPVADAPMEIGVPAEESKATISRAGISRATIRGGGTAPNEPT